MCSSDLLAAEAGDVAEAAKAVAGEYTVDKARVVAHGMGVGGQMGFYLAFHARDLFRGVATTGAALTTALKEDETPARLAFFLVAGGKDPLAKAVAESRDRLTEHKFPVVYREIPEMGHQYLDAVTLRELIRWIDSLDRQ